MSATEFNIFQEKSINSRAKYHGVESDMTAENALLRAQEEFSTYCPQGLETNDQFFYNLILEENNYAGYVWFAIRNRNNKKRIFINDLLLEETFRGRGLSKFILSWLELKANELGIDEIGLHVLGSNSVARGLYEKMEYLVSNVDMVKKLVVKPKQ